MRRRLDVWLSNSLKTAKAETTSNIVNSMYGEAREESLIGGAWLHFDAIGQ